jgi:YfiR/HmsC-like
LLRIASTRSPALRLFLLVLFSALAPGTPVLRAQERPTEYQVKAVYLFNFSRFVGWPPQAPSTPPDSFPICVLGKDPFGPALDAALAGENISGKSVVARRVAQPQDAAACRVVYISTSEEGRLKDVLAALDKTGVLTVSDIPRFSQRGGMIQFVLQGDRVRFEVNLTSATEAGLTLSSDLLKVAAAVRRIASPGA